jgi:hypothetical protein
MCIMIMHRKKLSGYLHTTTLLVEASSWDHARRRSAQALFDGPREQDLDGSASINVGQSSRPFFLPFFLLHIFFVLPELV